MKNKISNSRYLTTQWAMNYQKWYNEREVKWCVIRYENLSLFFLSHLDNNLPLPFYPKLEWNAQMQHHLRLQSRWHIQFIRLESDSWTHWECFFNNKYSSRGATFSQKISGKDINPFRFLESFPCFYGNIIMIIA